MPRVGTPAQKRAAERAYYSRTRSRRRACQNKFLMDDWRRRLLYGSRVRAKRLALPHTLTLADIVIPSFCPILGVPLVRVPGKQSPHAPSLDRVVPSLGYVPGNVRVISQRANTLKSNMSIDIVRALLRYLEEA